MNAPIDITGHFYTRIQREWLETSDFVSLAERVDTSHRF